MKQCLGCQGPCDDSASYCAQCRQALEADSVQSYETEPEQNVVISDDEAQAEGARTIPVTHRGEESFYYLNVAARRIEEVEADSSSSSKGLRPARLSPLRDISAEIQRASTPLPSTADRTFFHHAFDLPDSDPGEQWRWAQALNDIDDFDDSTFTEDDPWTDSVDPLAARHIPTSGEGLRVDEEDIRRALSQRISTMVVAVQQRPRKYIHWLFIWVISCALVALCVDIAMVSLLGHENTVSAVSGQPSLTLSKSNVRYGDTVVLSLRNFTPSGQVMLSRNIGENVALTSGGSLVKVQSDGSLRVTMVVQADWNPGQQMIEAEDVHTHYTASALLVLGSGQPSPAHLSVSQTTLDFGQQVQGGTNIESLNLVNSGGGTISWSASSQSSWLMLTPVGGLFSDQQTIQIAADRSNLKPGNYEGTITIVSNVSSPIVIHASMVVLSIPSDAGAVMDVSPAALSFTAIDGGSNPAAQTLSIVNEGHQDLYWEIDPQSLRPLNQTDGSLIAQNSNWLHFQTTSGKVATGGRASIVLKVDSSDLLQGTYTVIATFRSAHGHSMYNDPQQVAISLTVQPRCGTLLSTGGLSFTATAGQSVASQTVNLTSSLSCQGTVHWNSSTNALWLSVTPGSGSVSGANTDPLTVNVNVAGMAPGKYVGFVLITADHSSQSVSVQLTIQESATPTSGVPVMGISSLSLNFAPPAGATSTTSQAVGIANTGGSVLVWHASVPSDQSWLSVSQSSGEVQPGSNAHLLVNVIPGGLPPNVYTYTGQVIVSATDATGVSLAGSPQIITVTLSVSAPCSITLPSSSSLTFNATQGSGDPGAMRVSISASGSCSWPLSWRATANSSSWLNLPDATGSFTANGQTASISVNPTIQGLTPGTYTGSVAIAVTDANGNVISNTAHAVGVTLVVQAPCSFQMTSGTLLTINVLQGRLSDIQSLNLGVTGNCALPVNWTATISTSGSSRSWLTLTTPAGNDDGTGSVLVYQADATALQPGVYSGSIDFQVTDAGGTAIRSVVPISVILNVSGYTVSGSVSACDSNASCAPDVSDTLTLVSSSGVSITTSTAVDGSFQFTNVANGSYILTTDDSSTVYNVTVSNDAATVAIVIRLQATPTDTSTSA